MAVTLSRRIRRIGLLPTTYKEIKEDVLGHDEGGAEVILHKTKKVPVRHHSRMSNDTRQTIVSNLRTEAAARRAAAKKK